MTEQQPVLLSVIVVVVSGPSHLRRCLQSLLQQNNPPGMEIIVPHATYDSEIAALSAEFPAVRFHSAAMLADVPLEGPYRPHSSLDILRGEGIRVARGEIIALTEDHARLDPNWAAGMVQSHSAMETAAVGGPIENEVDRSLNWAVYFSDFGRYQSPVPTGQTHIISDVNISYKRSALESVREAWTEFYHEPYVNEAIRQTGARLVLSADPVLFQHREDLRLGSVLRERYQWGRYYAANRVRNLPGWERAARILLSPLLPLVLVARMTQLVLQRKRQVGPFLRSFPVFFLLTLLWSYGEFAGYLVGNGHPADSHARKLAFNFTYLSAGEVFSKVFSFLAFTLLARVLGPDRFGSLEFTIALLVFFQLLVDLGSGAYGARGVARDPAAVDSFVGSIVTLRSVLSLAVYAVLALFAFTAIHDSELRWLVLLYGLVLFASPGMLQWVFQGFDRMKPVALAQLMRQSVFALLVLLLVRNAGHLRIVPFMEIAAVVVVVFCNLYMMRILLPGVRFRWDLPGAVAAFRQTLPIGLSELTWACTWYFPTVLLALMVGGSPVGWFGAAQRPVMTMHGFVWLYFYNMLPSLSRAVDQPRENLRLLLGRSLEFTAWPAVFVAVSGTLFAEFALTLVFGEEYRQSVRTFQILVWVLSIALLSGHYRYVLVAFNHQRYEFLSSLYTAILSVGLCALLIPGYGAEGAAAALLFSGVVNWGLAYRFVQQKVETIPVAAFLVRPAAAGAVMWIIFVLLRSWNFWAAATLSVALFVVAFFLLRPSASRRVTA